MRIVLTLVLLILTAVGAFVAGRSSSNAAEVTVNRARVTNYDRELMASLNAIQSAVNTGVNVDRYAELIAAGRTNLANLKLGAPSSMLADPAADYLNAHAVIFRAWESQKGNAKVHVFADRANDPELYALIGAAIPAQSPSEPVHEIYSITVLWPYTEQTLWTRIMRVWRVIDEKT